MASSFRHSLSCGTAELSHLLHWLLACITQRKEKTKVIISGENHRDLSGNHKRQGFCFRFLVSITGHFEYIAILDFGQRKNGNQFFLNPHVSKI